MRRSRSPPQASSVRAYASRETHRAHRQEILMPDSRKPPSTEPPNEQEKTRGADVRDGAQRGLLAYEARRERGRLERTPAKPRRSRSPGKPGKR